MEIAAHIRKVARSEIRTMIASAPSDAINLALGEIQFPLSDFLKRKASEIIQNQAITYTPNQGLSSARQAVASYYQNRVSKDQICLTCGAEEAIFASLFSLLNPGDEVLLSDPTFLAYPTIIRMLGATPVFFDLDPQADFKIDFSSLEKVYSPKIKILLLCHPSNPLSSSFSPSEIQHLIAFAKKNNIFVIVDEIYRDLYLSKREASWIDYSDDILVISGLSKSHAFTGWRIGWIVTRNASILKSIITSHQFICTCAPSFSQFMIQACLSEEGMQHNESIRIQLQQKRKLFISILKDKLPILKIHPSTFAPYCFIRVPKEDKKIAEELSKQGLITVFGSAFGKNGKGFIRICYAQPNHQLISAIDILSKVIQKFF